MAKRVIWSPHAAADRISILDYWFNRIGNKNYSKRLDGSLKGLIKLISIYPEIGKRFDDKEVRFFVKDYYQIFYKIAGDEIRILHIWDSRRNPDDLKM